MSQVNAASRAAHGAARRSRMRERLIEAAINVVAEQGPNVTIDSLVAGAGVARGTFYNHFPTVDALFLAVADHMAETARLDLAVRLEHLSDPILQLAASSHYFLQRTRREPVWAWAIQNMVSLQNEQFPTVPRVFRSMFRRGVEAGWYRPGDPMVANVVVAGALRAAQRQLLLVQTTAEFDLQVVAMLLAGLGVPGDDALRISRETANEPDRRGATA